MFAMADHHEEEEEEKKEESLLEKIYISRSERNGSSSSSDSDDEKSSPVKTEVYRLFGQETSVHGVLGGGKLADLLLWRDTKVSGGVLGVATVIWFYFDVLEHHLLTVVCHGLVLGLAFVFLWSNASTFVKRSPPRIPAVHIPEEVALKVASALRIQINHAFSVLRDIVCGRDVKKFLSVIASLWVISIVGGWCDFLTLLYTATLLLLSVPLLYERYEDKVDSFAGKTMAALKKEYEEFDVKVLSKIPRGPSKDEKSDQAQI